MMFCREGPWHEVDRVWTIRVGGGGEPRLMHHGVACLLALLGLVEVLIDLTDPGTLAIGMKVDVYFRQDGPPTR